MCPLRLILIFLSATLAGFFVLKNLKSQPKFADTATTADDSPDDFVKPGQTPASANQLSKVRAAIGTGFWTCVDMASGRYLWRNLVSSSSPHPKGAK
ncbi:hypothetical protein RJ639_046750 [Escallonia herrerae]|uniref:Uncharacterized protein n=1 Tax=Escallonia herrerae TaxID=1293975 RepID=A0AA88W8I4_9ASTE|nr:hypothetical protein RJ639_046750 [Escallonia herrerae]